MGLIREGKKFFGGEKKEKTKGFFLSLFRAQKKGVQFLCLNFLPTFEKSQGKFFKFFLNFKESCLKKERKPLCLTHGKGGGRRQKGFCKNNKKTS